jgi:hypothetical protein
VTHDLRENQFACVHTNDPRVDYSQQDKPANFGSNRDQKKS